MPHTEALRALAMLEPQPGRAVLLSWVIVENLLKNKKHTEKPAEVMSLKWFFSLQKQSLALQFWINLG